MRTLGFLAALLLGASATLAGPEIFWRETFHNFGAFNEDSGPARCTFRYVNTGVRMCYHRVRRLLLHYQI